MMMAQQKNRSIPRFKALQLFFSCWPDPLSLLLLLLLPHLASVNSRQIEKIERIAELN